MSEQFFARTGLQNETDGGFEPRLSVLLESIQLAPQFRLAVHEAVLLANVLLFRDLLREPHVEEQVELPFAGRECGHGGRFRGGIQPLSLRTLSRQLGRYPVGHRLREGNLRDSPVHLSRDNLFADVALGAGRDALRTPQVVVALLRLGGDGASALTAPEDSAVDEGLELGRLSLALPGHHRLRLVEEALGDNRLVLALECLAVVQHDAVVEGVLEHHLEVRRGELPARERHEPGRRHDAAQLVEGVASGGVQLERLAHETGLLVVDYDGPPVPVVEVPDGRLAGPDAVAELLADAALYVLREVVDVVFALREGHVEHELAVRGRLEAERGEAEVPYLAGIHEVHDAASVHAVSREPVGVPREDALRLAGLDLREHQVELRPAGSLCRPALLEGADEVQALAPGHLAQLEELGFDGEDLAIALISRFADVEEKAVLSVFHSMILHENARAV